MLRYVRSELLAAPMLLLASFCFANPAGTAPATSPDTVAVFETKMALRDLWVEHVFWIRSHALATKAGDEAQRKVAEAEVVDNAKALAATITPFYGQPAADGMLKLLAGHWSAVRDYNTAVVSHSQSDRDKAVQGITANAHEIAKFLSGANPYLPEDAVFGLLSAHGAHHVAQIDQIAANDFRDEARTWQAMRQHMLVIADSITDALAKQFPDRFSISHVRGDMNDMRFTHANRTAITGD
jgi:hypothetical protein